MLTFKLVRAVHTHVCLHTFPAKHKETTGVSRLLHCNTVIIQKENVLCPSLTFWIALKISKVTSMKFCILIILYNKKYTLLLKDVHIFPITSFIKSIFTCLSVCLFPLVCEECDRQYAKHLKQILLHKPCKLCQLS